MLRAPSQRLFFPGLAAVSCLAIACGSSLSSGGPYNTPTPAAGAQNASLVGTQGNQGTPSGAPDALADIKARGTLHGNPVSISASGGRPERWLVFLGTADVARAAWVVTPGAGARALVPVDDWPEAVKVDEVVMHGQTAIVIVETIATLDQPAGIKSIWTIDANFATAGSLDDDWRFVGAQTADEIRKRLNAPPPSTTLRHEDMLIALSDAGKSTATMAKAFPKDGADYYMVWQGALVKPVEHVDGRTIGHSANAKKMLAMTRAAAVQERCETNICWAYGEHNEVLGGVALAKDGGSVVIAGFVESALAPEAAPNGTTQVVNPGSGSTATETALKEQVLDKPAKVLGEAPLRVGKDQAGADQASIGVAESADPDHHLLVVVHDGAFTRVYNDVSVVKGGITPRGIRFADVDGDGRTDVIVLSSGRWESGATTVTYARTLLAPRSVQTFELQGDMASEFAMKGTNPDPTKVDDALKAAVDAATKVPTHGIRHADACRVLARAHTVPGFSAVATKDARVLTFDQQGWPMLHGTSKALGSLRPDDVHEVGRHCKAMTCDPSRPVCTYMEPGSYSEDYFFSFEGGVPRVAGAAFYNGS